MSLMPNDVREVIRLLEKQGWVEMRTRGSHRQFKHPEHATISGNHRTNRDGLLRLFAYSPDVSGCAAVGDTEEEPRRHLQDALAAHFQAMSEAGEPIPESHTIGDYVEVAAWSLRQNLATTS